MAHASLKLHGLWEVRRNFKLPGLSHSADASVVERAFTQVVGVRGIFIDVSRRLARARYETTQTDCEAIRAALDAVGFPAAE